MATKGTYAAYQTATAPTVDFGESTKEILGGLEARRQQKLAEELAKQKSQVEAAKYANELRKQASEFTQKLADSGKDMLGVDTSGMANALAVKLKDGVTNSYYYLMKKSTTANTEEQAELSMQIYVLNNAVNNFNKFQKDITDFYADFNTPVNGHPKYSTFGSAPTIITMTEAIKSAATQELVDNGNGTYNWGDRVEVSGLDSGDIRFKIKDGEGNVIADNTAQSITQEMKGGLKPWNDIHSFIMEGVELGPTKANNVDLSEEDIMMTSEYVNKGDTIKRLRKFYLDILKTNKDLYRDIIVGHYFDTKDESEEGIANAMAEVGYDIMKKEHDTSAPSKPGYAIKKKKEDNDWIAKNVGLAITGDKGSSNMLLGKSWPDTANIPPTDKGKTSIANGKVKNIEKHGDIYTVEVTDGEATGRLTYDLSDPKTARTIRAKLSEAFGSLRKVGDVDYKYIDSKVNIDELGTSQQQRDTEFKQKLPRTIASLKNFIGEKELTTDNVLSAVRPINYILQKNGYRFEVYQRGDGIGLMEIKDKNDNTILTSKETGVDDFLNEAIGLLGNARLENGVLKFGGQTETVKTDIEEKPIQTTSKKNVTTIKKSSKTANKGKDKQYSTGGAY